MPIRLIPPKVAVARPRLRSGMCVVIYAWREMFHNELPIPPPSP